jgi:uncharacterized membrane protein
MTKRLILLAMVFIVVALAAGWVSQGSKLVGSSNVGASQQGVSIALSANGNTAIIGGPYDDSSKGAVWIFIRTAGTWSQQTKIVPSTGVQAGFSVAISDDGNTVATFWRKNDRLNRSPSIGGAAHSCKVVRIGVPKHF